MPKNFSFQKHPILTKLSFVIALLGFLFFGATLYQLIPSLDTSSRSLRVVAPILGSSLLFILLGCFGILSTTDISLSDLFWTNEPISKLKNLDHPLDLVQVLFPTLIMISIISSFIVAKQKLFHLYYPAVWSDTYSYVQTASKPLDSLEFWAGTRPFMLSMIYKVFGLTQASILESTGMLENLTRFQLAFSCLAWLFFAWSLSKMLRRPAIKLIGFSLIIGFSLSLDISQWDRILLSESLSTSLFVITLGILFLIFECDDVSQTCRIILFSLLMISCLGYSFSRDANSYFILALAFLIAFSIIFIRINNRSKSFSSLALPLFLLFVFIIQTWSAKHGSRWQGPFLNILHDRILPSDSARQFFLEKGMPLGELPSELYSTDRQTFVRSAPQYPQLLEWIDDYGRSTYFRYLIANLPSSVISAAQHLPDMVSPQSPYFYASLRLSYPSWASAISTLLYPDSVWLVLLSSVIGSFTLSYLVISHSLNLHLLLPVALLITSIPLALVIFHGDTIELSRHAFQVAVQLRLSFIISLLAIFDLFLNQEFT